MRPEELIPLLTSLEAAADVVEAIDYPLLQSYRGWDLAHWSYDFVPWGVRFIHHDGDQQKRAVVAALNLPDVSAHRKEQELVVP